MAAKKKATKKTARKEKKFFSTSAERKMTPAELKKTQKDLVDIATGKMPGFIYVVKILPHGAEGASLSEGTSFYSKVKMTDVANTIVSTFPGGVQTLLLVLKNYILGRVRDLD